MYKVYKYENLVNGKMYIGVTKRRLSDRSGYKGRRYLYRGGELDKPNNSIFANSIREYGWDNFKRDIICEVEDINVAHIIEKLWIKEFKGLNLSLNESDGGTGTCSAQNNLKPKIKVIDTLNNLSFECYMYELKEKIGLKQSNLHRYFNKNTLWRKRYKFESGAI